MKDTSVTTILMVRHTDVENPKDIVYGRLPRFGLSSTGVGQAQEVGRSLSGLDVGALYASPQLRARQTARIIDEWLGLGPIRISTLIAEVLTGYEGQSNKILAGQFNFYDSLARPSDESIAMVARRMLRFLERSRRRHAGGIVVAISHADPIMILRAAVLGLPLMIESLRGRSYPEKGSIMQFSYVGSRPRPVVIYRPPPACQPRGSLGADGAAAGGLDDANASPAATD